MRKSTTWEQRERVLKLLAGLVWASLELAFWGARPQALTFIASILAGTELLRLAQRVGEKEQEG